MYAKNTWLCCCLASIAYCADSNTVPTQQSNHSTPKQQAKQPTGSLWPKNSISFCDKVSSVGSIVIVEVDTNDTGQWQDNTNMQRNNNGTDLTSLVKSGAALLTNKINLSPVDLRGVKKHSTSAGAKQTVQIRMRIPTLVTTNAEGKISVEGKSEIALGKEKRTVVVRGVCRVNDVQGGVIKFTQLVGGQLLIEGKGDFTNIKRLPLSQRLLSKFGLW